MSDIVEAVEEFRKNNVEFRRFVKNDLSPLANEMRELSIELRSAVKETVAFLKVLESPEKFLPRTIAGGVVGAFGSLIGLSRKK